MFGGFLESLTQLPLLARFALALAIIFVVPTLCQKVRLPSIVGLLLAGILFGPHGLHVGPKSHEVAQFFADVGKLLLMFFAGLEIDLVQFRRTGYRSLVFGLAIVVGLIVTKLLAACLTRWAFGYSLYQGLVMWSLSLPQVAATLAAALVAFEATDAQGQRLINEPVLNSVIVLLVVTSILGPILTEQFGNRLAAGTRTALPATNTAVVGAA